MLTAPLCWLNSDLCLHQIVPLSADVFEEAGDVDGALVAHLLHHAVQDDVGPGPAHARTAPQHKLQLIRCTA